MKSPEQNIRSRRNQSIELPDLDLTDPTVRSRLKRVECTIVFHVPPEGVEPLKRFCERATTFDETTFRGDDDLRDSIMGLVDSAIGHPLEEYRVAISVSNSRTATPEELDWRTGLAGFVRSM